MRDIVFAALSGVLFAAGLAIGGMTDPAKVLGFLDLFGRWDPTLAFVMGAALGVHALILRLARRPRPPATRTIDARLVGGAAIFGIGWGLVGYCPGPAFTALGAGSAGTVLFVLAMLGGIVLHRLTVR